MNHNNSIWLIVYISVCVGLLLVGQSSAQSFVVSPTGLENVEGESNNNSPFGASYASGRYQQVYAGSEFSGQTGPLTITEIAFRPDGDVSQAFSRVLADVQINLSTTDAVPDNMSLLFSANVGPDDSVVIDRGPLALSSSDTGPVGGPKDFDILLPFDTPFTYDPAAGNLLLDVRLFDAAILAIPTPFDAHTITADGVSRAFSGPTGDVNSLVSDGRDSLGLVTRFTITPEPAVLPLLVLSGLFLRPRRWA